MRTFSTFCLISAFALFVASCGESKEEQAAKEVDAPVIVKGMQEMAKQVAGQGVGCHGHVELVSFRELYTVLPNLG